MLENEETTIIRAQCMQLYVITVVGQQKSLSSPRLAKKYAVEIVTRSGKLAVAGITQFVASVELMPGCLMHRRRTSGFAVTAVMKSIVLGG
jgi:hypothetical protein